MDGHSIVGPLLRDYSMSMCRYKWTCRPHPSLQAREWCTKRARNTGNVLAPLEHQYYTARWSKQVCNGRKQLPRLSLCEKLGCPTCVVICGPVTFSLHSNVDTIVMVSLNRYDREISGWRHGGPLCWKGLRRTLYSIIIIAIRCMHQGLRKGRKGDVHVPFNMKNGPLEWGSMEQLDSKCMNHVGTRWVHVGFSLQHYSPIHKNYNILLTYLME